VFPKEMLEEDAKPIARKRKKPGSTATDLLPNMGVGQA
jgi:hypothetical protein